MGCFEERTRGVRVGEIRRDRADVDPVALGQVGGGLVELLLAARHENQVMTACGELVGELDAEAGGGAGHERGSGSRVRGLVGHEGLRNGGAIDRGCQETGTYRSRIREPSALPLRIGSRQSAISSGYFVS